MQPTTETVLKDINLSLAGNALTFERSEKNQVTLDLNDAQAAQLRGALRLLAPPGTLATDEMTAHSAKVRIHGSVIEISKLDVKLALNFSGAGADTADRLKALTALPPSPAPNHNDRFAEYCFHRSSGATAIGFSDHLAARRKYSALLESGIQNLGLAPEEDVKLRESINYTHAEVALQSVAKMYNWWAQNELNEYAPEGERLYWQEVQLDSGRDGEGAQRSKDARRNPEPLNQTYSGDYDSERVTLASDVIVDSYLRAVLRAHVDNFRGDPVEVVQRRALSSLLLGELPGGSEIEDWKVLKFPDSTEPCSFNDILEGELNRTSGESFLIAKQDLSALLACAEERWKQEHRVDEPPPRDLREWYINVLKESDAVRLSDSQWIDPKAVREAVSGVVNLEDYFALYRRARDEQTLGSEPIQREILTRMKREMGEFNHSEIIEIFEDKLHGIYETIDRGKKIGMPPFLMAKEEERRVQTEYFLEILRKFP